MTTIEQLYNLIQEHAEFTFEEFTDVASHGADAGWQGFTYHRETGAFYDKASQYIWDLLNERAEDQRITAMELFAQFRTQGTVTDESTFKNLMAWFALEEVARAVESGEISMEEEEEECTA